MTKMLKLTMFLAILFFIGGIVTFWLKLYLGGIAYTLLFGAMLIVYMWELDKKGYK